RRGLEMLEQEPSDVVVVAPENLPGETLSEYVAVSLVPMGDLARKGVDPTHVSGYIMAYRNWLPNPDETVGVRLEDDAMHPILPAGSRVAIDRSVTNPQLLQGRMVAAAPEGKPMVHWLDLSGRHMILRPHQPNREHPLIPIEMGGRGEGVIIGQVVWSW